MNSTTRWMTGHDGLPMSAEAVQSPPAVTRESRATGTRTRLAWLAVFCLVLLLACIASAAVGTRDIPISTVMRALFDYQGSDNEVVVRASRIPRTVLGLVVGVAIGVGGAMIQAVTRNPLADPVVLGITPGAMFSVALAVGVFGFRSIHQYLWFALIGSAVAMAMVYAIGRSGRWGATPIRLTLSGIAIGAVFTAFTLALTLLNPSAFDQMRAWDAGSIAGRGWDVTVAVLPFVLVGLAITASVARGLDAIALGDDMARALGTQLARTRTLGLIAITLLCGAAAAAAGPIVFVGLMIPHIARWLVGANQRWILLISAIAAPALVLAADVLGRIALRPAELPVGIVSAFLGAPALIWLVRRKTAIQP